MSKYANAAAAIFAIVVIAMYSWWIYMQGVKSERVKFDAYKSEMVKATAIAQAKAIEAHNAISKANQDNEAKYAKLKQQSKASADASRSQLDSLRNTIATNRAASDSQTAAECRAYAGRQSNALGICAEHLAQNGARADDLANQVTGLQRYVRDVCLAEIGSK